MAAERPLRIALLSRLAPPGTVGGIQDHLADLALGLTRAGHTVTAFVGDSGGATRDDPRFKDSVVVQLPDSRWHDPLSPTGLLQSFRRVEAERAFDVVNAEGRSGLPLARARDMRLRPLVATLHSGPTHELRSLVRVLAFAARERENVGALVDDSRRRSFRAVQKYWADREFWAYRRWHVVVVNGRDARVAGLLFQRDPARLHVIPNGVWGDARPSHISALDFLIPGRVTVDKGHLVALRALAIAGSAVRINSVTVAGDGPGRRLAEQWSADLGLTDRVRFIGTQAFASMEDCYRNRITLLPSLWEESQPLALLRAIRSGSPVIASRVGGVPDIARVSSGLVTLVPPGSPIGIADAIKRLASRIPYWTVPSASFRADEMVSRTLDVYRGAIGEWQGEVRLPGVRRRRASVDGPVTRRERPDAAPTGARRVRLGDL